MISWSAVTWDVARAGGVTAYALVTISVVLGLALSMRWQSTRWPRLLTNEAHGYVTTLSLVFIAVHSAAVWLDPFMGFGWQEVFVPFASHYRPLWIALGIVATYLALAVWASTKLRPWIGFAWWRRLHVATFGVYLLATIHGIGTGTDTRTAWALALYGTSALVVGTLTARRLMVPIGARGTAHPRLAALTAGVLVVGLLWTVAGPARSGWNAIANNRQGNGARGGSAAGISSGQTPAVTAFSSSLQGTTNQVGPDASGNTTVRFSAKLGDGTGRMLTVSIGGLEAADGSLNVSTTRVALVQGSGAASFEGPVTSLEGTGGAWRFTAALSPAASGAATMQVTVTLNETAGGQVTGAIDATPVADTSGQSGA